MATRSVNMDERGFLMNIRFPAVLVFGFVAGLTGGVASHFLTPEKRSDLRPGPLRARRIELVDEAGKTRAFLGTDMNRTLHSSFLTITAGSVRNSAFGPTSIPPS